MDVAITDTKYGKPSREQQMEAIMAEHETALLRYATRLVNSPVTAQDIVQNVFIKLFKCWKEGTHPSDRLKGWLYRVTHNQAVDYIRRESRLRTLHQKHAEQTLRNCPDGRNCPASLDERKEKVLSLLTKLHPREQQVILLRMEEGLSYKEISDITGRSEGNVGNILHHAVRKLSKQILSNVGLIPTTVKLGNVKL